MNFAQMVSFALTYGSRLSAAQEVAGPIVDRIKEKAGPEISQLVTLVGVIWDKAGPDITELISKVRPILKTFGFGEVVAIKRGHVKAVNDVLVEAGKPQTTAAELESWWSKQGSGST